MVGGGKTERMSMPGKLVVMMMKCVEAVVVGGLLRLVGMGCVLV